MERSLSARAARVVRTAEVVVTARRQIPTDIAIRLHKSENFSNGSVGPIIPNKNLHRLRCSTADWCSFLA